ncbi:MAG: tetratricopeptide repeat protein [Bdellovibrionota bacterium]
MGRAAKWCPWLFGAVFPLLLFSACSAAVRHTESGDRFKAEGNIESAIAEYERAIAADPAYGPAYCSLGKALMLKGDAPRAAEWLQKGIGVQPDDAPLRNCLGTALLLAGEPGRAEEEFLRALEIHPAHDRAAENLFNLVIDYGAVSIDSVAAVFEARAKANPTDVHALGQYARILAMKQNFDSAVSFAERAVAIKPESPEAWADSGFVFLAQGNHLEAAKSFRAAIERAPQNAEYRKMLASALLKAGQVSEALVTIQQMIQMSPSDPHAFFLLGEVYGRLGEFGKAKEAYQQALKYNLRPDLRQELARKLLQLSEH